MTDAQSFQMEEYRALRTELSFYIAEFRSQERNVVIAVGVIWAWLLSNSKLLDEHAWGYLPWSVPVILTAAATVRSYVLNKHMRVISDYIQTLERAFGLEDGWESTFTSKVRRVKRSNFANSVLTYALLALSVVVFLFHARLVNHVKDAGDAPRAKVVLVGQAATP